MDISIIVQWLEQHIALLIIFALLAVNALMLLALLAYVKLYGHMPDGALRSKLHQVVYEIDRAVDNMENPAKRSMAIVQFQQVLGWKKVFLPAAVIGFIIDAEVAVIRKMQAVVGVTDLHQEEGVKDNG